MKSLPDTFLNPGKKFQRYGCLFLLLFIQNSLLAQEGPRFEWARRTGSTDTDYAHAMTTDAAGNVYVTGSYSNTVDFDPGPGVFNLTSVFSYDMFVLKLDVNGNFVWAKSMGGTSGIGDIGYAITIDGSGNVYVGGQFGGTADFDPGPGVVNLVGTGIEDIFVCKLDSNGDLVWAKAISSTSREIVKSIAVDASGNVYTTGIFWAALDFDPGPGVFTITPPNLYGKFVSKLDDDGNFVWAKAFYGTGGGNIDSGLSIAIDANGNNIYTTGVYMGTSDFNPGAGVYNLTASASSDVYISKLDSDGNFVWAHSFGGVGFDSGNALTIDNAGDIVAVADIVGTGGDFDPGPGTYTVNPGAVVYKLTPAGNLVWAKTVGNGNNITPYAITTDDSHNVYTTGFFRFTCDFDPGGSTYNITASNFDLYISKLDVNGNFVWATSMGGSSVDVAYGIDVDAAGNIYTAGAFQSTADFDPGPCVYNLASATATYYDALIQKLSQGAALQAPSISSFTPATGPIGTTVTITGTNFSITPANNTVSFFNNRTATVTAATTTSLTVTVPTGTTTGAISVTTNCATATSITSFTVGAAVLPTITGFSPTSGSSGTIVTITGTNFNTGPAGNMVRFNGMDAAVTSSTATSITTTVPAGATTGKITVIVGGNTATSSGNFTVTCPQTTITNLAPLSGVVGDVVMITGTNFNTSPSANLVDFNGISAVVTASSSTSITTSVPVGAITGPISVNTGCSGATTDFAFTICGPAPTITSFSPTSGVAGASVTITGTNFSATPAGDFVYFNGVVAAVTSSTVNSITTAVPIGTTSGRIEIRIVCHTVISNADFNVIASLTITTQPAAVEACQGNNATFQAVATGTSGITYQWQYSPDGIVAFENMSDGTGVTGTTSSTLTINTSNNPGNGYFRCHISGNAAATSPVDSDVANLSITPKPAAPVAGSSSRCGDGSLTLNASGTVDGKYKWYTVPTDGTAITGAINGTYITPSLSATAEYYVAAVNSNCESNRTPVTATILPLPFPPSVTGASACPGSIITLSASGGSNGRYTWYTHASDPVFLPGEVNSSYTTPALVETTVFYVTITNNGCESLRIPVTATIVTTGCAPQIGMATLATEPEGLIVIDLKPLITTVGTLAVNSIRVIAGPPSGAGTSVEAGVLTIDYSGIIFSGLELITIEACTTNGLCGQQQFTIEVTGDVIVYNGISPNGDGKNETFLLQFIDALPATKTNSVFIYNRWGDEVFSVADYDNKKHVFAGRSNDGNKLPSGTYYYKIHFPLQGRTVTGYLSLKH